MPWDPRKTYDDKLVDLLDLLFAEHYPTSEAVIEAQKWLARELNTAKGPFPIRHSADIRQQIIRPNAANYPDKPRYYFGSDFDPRLPFDIIASDNESTASFFTRWLNADFNLNLTLRDALAHLICLGILQTDGAPHDEILKLRQFNMKMNNQPGRPALDGLKLCHLKDAGQGFGNVNTAESIVNRSYFCLSLLNVFPFPSPKKFHHTFDKRLFTENQKDLGEQTNFQNLVHHFLARKFIMMGSPDALEVLKVHYSRLGGTVPTLKQCNAVLEKYGESIVRIRPKDMTNNGNDSESGNDPENPNAMHRLAPDGAGAQIRNENTMQMSEKIIAQPDVDHKYHAGKIRLMRIGGGIYHDQFLDSGSQIVWEQSQQAMNMVQANTYYVSGINVFAVWNSGKILGLYRYATQQEVQNYGPDRLGNKCLLIRLLELNIPFRWPRGPVTGCIWQFDGLPAQVA